MLRTLADENSCWNTFASVIRYFAPNVSKFYTSKELSDKLQKLGLDIFMWKGLVGK